MNLRQHDLLERARHGRYRASPPTASSCPPALALALALHSHVIPFDHVEAQRDHLDAVVRGILALNTVREDDVAVVVAALELALGSAANRNKQAERQVMDEGTRRGRARTPRSGDHGCKALRAPPRSSTKEVG
jgi:hypothetical protein